MARRKKKSAAPAPESGADLLQAALERYRPLLSENDFAALLAELDRPLYPALRVNTLKADPAQAIETWASRYGWQVQPVPYCPTGYRVTESPAPISQTIEHRMGQYYIQDAASMLPVELFDFDELDAPLVLDMAASPGGKTTHISSRIRDRGLVLANDSSADRITALRIVLNNYGAINAAAARFPGEKYGAWFPETFDRVLLDAPCSMQGLKTTESHPMRPITEKEQSALAQRQARLLASGFQALKTGGQLVYSTCTLAPEENEAVLETLLQAYPGAVEIVDLSTRLPVPAPALAADGERAFDPRVQRAARLWPHRFGTAGFFAALLIKTAPVTAETEPPPDRPLEQAGMRPVPPREGREISAWLQKDYGFDLDTLLEAQDLELWQRQDKIYAVPSLFTRHFRGLPVQRLGLLLAEEGQTGRVLSHRVLSHRVLSHEWAARFGPGFTRGKLVLAEDQVAGWLRGEDLHSPPAHTLPKGFIALVTDPAGRNLGRGRILHDRVKNLLPARLI